MPNTNTFAGPSSQVIIVRKHRRIDRIFWLHPMACGAAAAGSYWTKTFRQYCSQKCDVARYWKHLGQSNPNGQSSDEIQCHAHILLLRRNGSTRRGISWTNGQVRWKHFGRWTQSEVPIKTLAKEVCKHQSLMKFFSKITSPNDTKETLVQNENTIKSEAPV